MRLFPTVALAAAICLGAWAQKPRASPPLAAVPETTVSSRLLRLNIGNAALLQMAQLGEKRGATAAVRNYAHRMALDHRLVKNILRLEFLGPAQTSASPARSRAPSPVPEIRNPEPEPLKRSRARRPIGV